MLWRCDLNPYGVDTTEHNLQGPLISLGLLYDGMPQTTGCERCEEINGDRDKWCCRRQAPSMYYVEFLAVWLEAQKWDQEKRQKLILRAVRNYLDPGTEKGCIFFDSGCRVYETRTFVCRMYGVIPKENWDKRWEKLKKEMGDAFHAEPQCTLVSAEKEITPEDEDKWFAHTRKCEKRIGVNPAAIALHDIAGGSYRTFHDHLLIELFPPDFLEMLTRSRLSNPSKEDIDATIEVLRKKMGMHENKN